MAESKSSCNEFAEMSPEEAVAIVTEMLDRYAREYERAEVLAIVLHDRLQGRDDGNSDPTDAVLAGMLMEELCGDPVPSVKRCLSALLEKCKIGEAL